MLSKETTARYQQVLAWRAEGLTYRTIGDRLGVGTTRAIDIHHAAQRWHRRLTTPLPPPHPQRLSPDQPVDAAPIPARAKTNLHRHGLHTVGDVAAVTDAALLAMSSIGPHTVAAMRTAVAPEGQQGA